MIKYKVKLVYNDGSTKTLDHIADSNSAAWDYVIKAPGLWLYTVTNSVKCIEVFRIEPKYNLCVINLSGEHHDVKGYGSRSAAWKAFHGEFNHELVSAVEVTEVE